MVSIPCPHCGAKLKVPEATLGKNGRCPKCKQKFLVQVPAPLDELDPLGTSPAPLGELDPLRASPAPLDEFDPLAASSAPLGDFDPLAQPLPPAAMPLSSAMSLPSQTAARHVVKGQTKPKAENAGLGNRQKIILLVSGGILLLSLALFVVVGGLVYLFARKDTPVGGGSSGSGDGQYAVVDSLPTSAAKPEESSPPLDLEYVPAPKNVPAEEKTTKAEWSVKPDPPSGDERPPADVVGALSPEPSLLLASLGGPFAVGVPPDPNRARRAKALKGADGMPGELVSIDKEPHPVLDIRTGKPTGQFPAEAQIRFSCRLSPDGRYLTSWAVEVEQSPQGVKLRKHELVVWQRDADEPACRWPLPGPVLWADFIEPDRLALYYTTPKPEFVVLDVTKGTPVVTAPLPADDFSAEHDHLNPSPEPPYYRVQTASGAVSPGRKLIALGGRTNIVLLQADGRVAGKLPVEQVFWARNYLGMSFNEDGSQLRALTDQGGGEIYLRVWSLADGQSLHKTLFRFDPRAGHEGMLDFLAPLQIVTGPEPNSLFVGDKVFSLTAGHAYAELPYQVQRRLDEDRLLALGTIVEAPNANELTATVDFVPRGKSLIVPPPNREWLVSKAPNPSSAVVSNAPGETAARPAPTPPDRSKVTAIRLKPPAAWAVKPGAEVARPAGPLPLWPHAFAASEAAFVTESLSWIRYDLNTGNTIGEPIELWPGQPPPSGPMGWHTAALARDGQSLALIDSKDPARVDVWDITGKRLIGLRPYDAEPLLWLGWSADGKLLTADRGHLSGWDLSTAQAAYEVEGNFARFLTAPGAEWVMATTPARHVFFVDSATGQGLGHIPASPACPEQTLSPDGKTLFRLGQWPNVQAWDLQSGKRSNHWEAPLVPLSLAIGGAGPEGMRLGVFWIGTRRILSHTKTPGEQYPRYYLYDLDAHTHTYSYQPNLGTFQNDSLGRAWMTSRTGGSETWTTPNIPGAGAFDQTLAFSPGTTVRVEVDVGSREASRKTAEKMAASLAALGFKIGRDGWVMRADHKTSNTSTDLTDSMGQRGIRVATLNITWSLLDPAGKEAWQGTSGGKFDPFTSKYVVLGSRKTDMAAGGLGGGSTEVRLDYKGKDAMTAQVEEILEKYWYPGVPTCLVKNEGGYSVLPLAASEEAEQKR